MVFSYCTIHQDVNKSDDDRKYENGACRFLLLFSIQLLNQGTFYHPIEHLTIYTNASLLLLYTDSQLVNIHVTTLSIFLLSFIYFILVTLTTIIHT